MEKDKVRIDKMDDQNGISFPFSDQRLGLPAQMFRFVMCLTLRRLCSKMFCWCPDCGLFSLVMPPNNKVHQALVVASFPMLRLLHGCCALGSISHGFKAGMEGTFGTRGSFSLLEGKCHTNEVFSIRHGKNNLNMWSLLQALHHFGGSCCHFLPTWLSCCPLAACCNIGIECLNATGVEDRMAVTPTQPNKHSDARKSHRQALTRLSWVNSEHVLAQVTRYIACGLRKQLQGQKRPFWDWPFSY